MELTRGRGTAIARALLVAGVVLARSAAASAEGPATFGPNVSYYQVDASELGPFTTGNPYGNFGLLRYSLDVGGFRLVAPIHLPSGALMTSIELDFYDGSPTQSIYASLATCDNADGVCQRSSPPAAAWTGGRPFARASRRLPALGPCSARSGAS